MTNAVDYRKFRRAAFSLLLVILLIFLSGCTEKSGAQGVLNAGEISKCESLYGCEKQAAFDGLNLSQGDMDSKARFVYAANQKREISNEQFYTILLFDLQQQNEVFSGINFIFLTEDKDKATALVCTLFQLSKDSYGEPSTYEGIINRISKIVPTEGIESSQEYFERWEIGETTEYTLSIDQIEETIRISLVYRYRPR